ncbi:MAG: PilN domain-containing protein [Bdellovibrionales bacterium]|nr:PilN domain-containing protein [Bdellovibrionales bacterium]
MIKVNLLKAKVPLQTQAQQTQGFSVQTGGGESTPKDKVVKVLVMLLGAVALMVYEKINIDALESQQKMYRTQSTQLTQELQKIEASAGQLEELKKENEKLQEKLKILTNLSKNRLKELKALDNLQNFIPEGVWLESLDYDGDKVLFKGFATNDRDLNAFVESLEGSTYFIDVILSKAIEQQKDSGAVKEFEINSALGDG